LAAHLTLFVVGRGHVFPDLSAASSKGSAITGSIRRACGCKCALVVAPYCVTPPSHWQIHTLMGMREQVLQERARLVQAAMSDPFHPPENETTPRGEHPVVHVGGITHRGAAMRSPRGVEVRVVGWWLHQCCVVDSMDSVPPRVVFETWMCLAWVHVGFSTTLLMVLFLFGAVVSVCCVAVWSPGACCAAW